MSKLNNVISNQNKGETNVSVFNDMMCFRIKEKIYWIKQELKTEMLKAHYTSFSFIVVFDYEAVMI